MAAPHLWMSVRYRPGEVVGLVPIEVVDSQSMAVSQSLRDRRLAGVGASADPQRPNEQVRSWGVSRYLPPPCPP
jgi:hypothetical protein